MYYDEINTEILREIKKINKITYYWGSEKFLTINTLLEKLLENIIEKTKYYSKKEIYGLYDLLQKSGISSCLIHALLCFIREKSYEMYNFEKYHTVCDILNKNY